MKSLPWGTLDASRINAALAKHFFILRGEVFAHYSDHANIGEIARGKREESCRAAQGALHITVRAADTIERNRPHHQDGHQLAPALCSRYLSSNNASFFRVAGGILSGCVSSACFSADPHLHDRVRGMAATAARTTSQALAAFWVSTWIICSTLTESWRGCQQS